MMGSATIAYIGLGANLGDKEEQLRQAVKRLHGEAGIRVERCSNIYETDPVGVTDQPPFLNMVARIRTILKPEPLLDACARIERSLGRVRDVRWGPRTIDLDVLLYGDEAAELPRLTIPHPRMFERLFVLIPLLEVLDEDASAAVSSREALETLDGKEGVRLWRKINWPEEFEHSAN
jgi:2-amino-4-hydroxy-6-hydroxymethyldihydropteridine diphosphokinase